MRILYHHRTLGDGAEGIHIDEMVAAFRRLGHEVLVRGLAGGTDRTARQTIVRGIRGVLPRAAFELASVASNVPDYLDVGRIIRDVRPDFLYKRHARYDVGALDAARQAGVPAVLEVNCLFSGPGYHHYEPLAFGRLAAAIERRALTRARVVLAVSTPLARDIDTAARVRAVVMPNGADPDRFDPVRARPGGIRARYGLDEAVTVGWAGVMREWHGLELLIDAVAAIPGVRLLLVGDGPARPAFERRVSALGLTGRVAITGRIPHADMPDHLAAMDIAVVASDGTGVASPMKLVEYMAMGLAVVAPDLDNMRDLVTHEDTGLLFPAGDPSSLARLVSRLSGDAALRQRLGRSARRAVERERNWLRNAERVLALLDGPLARPAQARAGRT